MSWQLAAFLVLGLALAAGFAWFERSRPPARVVSLVAALAALAVVGRIAFAAIPNVKPTTDVVLFAGYALGAAPGFAVGAVTALASNFFISQGPWTPWQMAGWGLVGIYGAVLARMFGRDLGRIQLAVACGAAGLLFGAVMNTHMWTLAASHDLATWIAISGTSLTFDLAHVSGNVVFCLLLGPPFVRALERFRRRFEVRWPRPAPVAAGLAAIVAGGLLLPAPGEASPTSRAASYLRSAQNADGGFGGAPGRGSNQLHTGWAALGLAAAGRNPADVGKGGRSVIDYIKSSGGSLNDLGELERTILVLRASSMSPRNFQGRDLVAELRSKQRSNGSWASNNAWTAFGILAMRAAGEGNGSSSVKRARTWLARQQGRDGGFGVAPGATSDTDNTGSVLQALGASGLRSGKRIDRAVAFLRGGQNRDGGFGQLRGYDSNTQSTAWAVQGVIGVGRGAGVLKRGSRTALGYIRSLQSSDGSVRYSRRSTQTPVWVTADALRALAGKSFPLRPVKRLGKSARDGSGSGADGEDGSGGGSGSGSGAEGGDGGGGGEAAPAAGGGGQQLGPPAPGTQQTSSGVTWEKRGEGGGPSAGLLLGLTGAGLLAAGVAVWLFRRRFGGRVNT
ncbi:MAG TPA: prenyltransferase/squalene oxidase repeat-containing protein [Thermoleophilaceae bacterium]